MANYIGIAESADDIFGKAMSISDDLMWRYYELLTDLSVIEVSQIKAAVSDGSKHPRDAKVELAKLIVTDFHSQAAADTAESEFNRRFREHQAPSTLMTTEISHAEASIKIVDLLVTTNLSSSKTDARRLIAQGGVKVNNEKISDANLNIEIATAPEILLQVRKLKFLKVKFI